MTFKLNHSSLTLATIFFQHFQVPVTIGAVKNEIHSVYCTSSISVPPAVHWEWRSEAHACAWLYDVSNRLFFGHSPMHDRITYPHLMSPKDSEQKRFSYRAFKLRAIGQIHTPSWVTPPPSSPEVYLIQTRRMFKEEKSSYSSSFECRSRTE